MYLTEYEELIPKANTMSKRTKEFASAFYSKCNRQSLGKVSEEFFKCNPTTMKEWFDYYTTNVRTLEQIYNISAAIVTEMGLQTSVDDLYLYYIYEVIVNTYRGFSKELEIIQTLKNMGLSVEHASSELDVDYGVDLIVDDKYFIQIKPISFLYKNNNQSLINDRRLALIKEQKAKNEFGNPTFFIFYDNNGKLVMKNNKYCHRLKDYVNNDGLVFKKVV